MARRSPGNGVVSATPAPPAARAAAPGVYRRHRPETTALYEVVRDNLETLYGAIDDGALAVRIPKHARKELEAYLDCGFCAAALLGSGARGAARAGWWRSVARVGGFARRAGDGG